MTTKNDRQPMTSYSHNSVSLGFQDTDDKSFSARRTFLS